MSARHTIEKLLRQQAALAHFGSFAFREPDLQSILTEAARICAESLGIPYTKICRYRTNQDDLLVIAGYGWEAGVVGHFISQADESSTQGRAYVTGEPVILEDIRKNNSYNLPPFYAQHNIVSTVDVLIKGKSGSFGVLEADSSEQRNFDEHDINFLTAFANVLAEAVETAERTTTLQTALTQMKALVADKDVLLEEKGTLAAELQHRVRNNLQLVYSMLLRQIEMGDENNKEDTKEGVRSIARRVMSLSTIYDHLLGHGLVQTTDFGSYLESLCEKLHDFQDKSEFDIALVCKAEPIVLDLDIVTALGIVMTEVISNAYLHAFPDRSGTINVNFVQKDQNGILTVSDDGVGLIKRLMEQAKGTAHVQSDHGTIWTLEFPLEQK